MTRRIRIHVGVGDIMETAAGVAACVAVGHLAGLWWGVLLAAILVFAAANLVYGNHAFAVPLPARRDFRMLRAAVSKPFVRARMRAQIAMAKARR